MAFEDRRGFVATHSLPTLLSPKLDSLKVLGIRSPPGLDLVPSPRAGRAQEGEIVYVPGRLLCQEAMQASFGAESDVPPVPELPLSWMLDDPDLGTLGTPSLGSLGHYVGMCRPCDFVCRGGACRAGVDCKFCHLCGPGENRRRKRENMKRKREFVK